MRRYLGGVITKNSVAPLTKNYYEPASGIWSINEAMQSIKQLRWPTQGFIAPSQVEYTTPGTYSWIAPTGTTSVSVVCVGAGGSNSGGGGELRYRNNIAVVPGTAYEVVVGISGQFWSGGAGSYATVSDGGFSQFKDSSTCRANGGRSVFNTSTNGGRGGVGDGGGRGGDCPQGGYFGYGVAGAGAGGYAGNGGDGTTSANVQGNAGAGGGGGGGTVLSGNINSYGRGGGVGLYGQGNNGAGGNPNPTPPYGSGPAGNYGQAGDGSIDVGGGTYASRAGMALGYGQGYIGGYGGVRIVWAGTSGLTRTFPTTNVLDL